MYYITQCNRNHNNVEEGKRKLQRFSFYRKRMILKERIHEMSINYCQRKGQKATFKENQKTPKTEVPKMNSNPFAKLLSLSLKRNHGL